MFTVVMISIPPAVSDQSALELLIKSQLITHLISYTPTVQGNFLPENVTTP